MLICWDCYHSPDFTAQETVQIRKLILRRGRTIWSRQSALPAKEHLGMGSNKAGKPLAPIISSWPTLTMFSVVSTWSLRTFFSGRQPCGSTFSC